MTQPIHTRRFREALARVRNLFVHAPGVKLTNADAARIVGLDRQVCRMLLQALIEAGFLEQGARGTFVRCAGTVAEEIRESDSDGPGTRNAPVPLHPIRRRS